MALEILVPVSTEVIEENPECVISGEYKDGSLVINIDSRKQEHHSQLGIPQGTKIHWGKEYSFRSGIVWIVLASAK